MRLGWSHHQAGDLGRAEQVYREVLTSEPGQPDAWYLLGAVQHVQGRLDEAVAAYHRAVATRPNHALTHHNLGVAYDTLGRTAEALASFQEAVRLNPEAADSYHSLGLIHQRLGQDEEARQWYEKSIVYRQKAVDQQPHSGQAHHMLGVALTKAGRLGEALISLQDTVMLMPDSADAQNDLGYVLGAQKQHEEAAACYRKALSLRPGFVLALNNLGLALGALDKPEEAIAHYEEALRLEPDNADVYNNLGLAYYAMKRPEEAARYHEKAVQLKPAFAVCYLNWAAALILLNRPQEAKSLIQKAIELRPRYAEAHTNLGLVFMQEGKVDQALACHEEALRYKPDYNDAHWNRALVLLTQGNFKDGWPAYESRWQRPEATRRSFEQPAWDGGPLDGRTIFLHAEQGQGDAIHFIRYGPLVKERGAGRIAVACHKSLIPLLSRCTWIDELVTQGSLLPAFDVHAALLSLPGLFDTTLETIPAKVPYLSADPDLVAAWRHELDRAVGVAPSGGDAAKAGPPTLKVGIAWQGNPKHVSDHTRSIPLACFAPLGQVPGIQLISLQKEAGVEQLKDLPKGLQVLDFGDRLDVTAGAFMDTAAIMCNLDLVISCDSALAHLAGALAVPVWLGLAFAADWRWLQEREDTPWYPTMRLFRQRERGNWLLVFERMAEALKSKIKR
jgi:tetratricopeptide (TPR) repeat protein